jgi:hypothetical protein
VADKDLEDDWKRLELVVPADGTTFQEAISRATTVLRGLESAAMTALAGFQWRIVYETDEALFRQEVIASLLRKMGFVDITQSHGSREYGKDFTFSEMTPFGILRHYGLQAKAGNNSGGNNSQIDEILGQLHDAFSMSYVAVNSGEERHISTFIVAISGRFTQNAKEKIIQKARDGLKGSVYFLDQEKVRELAERFWAIR